MSFDGIDSTFESSWRYQYNVVYLHSKEKINMKVNLLGKRILLALPATTQTTAAGIEIKKQQNITLIHLIGDQVTPGRFKDGDKVLANPIAGTSFEIDNVEYLMVREDDIIGILED